MTIVALDDPASGAMTVTETKRAPEIPAPFSVPCLDIEPNAMFRSGVIVTGRRAMLMGLLSGLFGLGGAGATAAPKAIDPKSILFSVPTISDDISPQQPAGEISPHDLVFHEDDWRQLEFYPASRLEEVKHALAELKKFEAVNRAQYGWRNVFVRHLRPAEILKDAQRSIGKLLGIGETEAPVLFTGTNTVIGRVAHGFTLYLGPKAWLYGAHDGEALVVLGAQMERGADDSLLVRAFMTLNREEGLIFVDWRQQMLLVGVDARGSVVAWRP